MRTRRRLLILLAAASVAVPAIAGEQVVAIRAGRIFPISGEPIADGVILIKDGKIAAVGREAPIPSGALVIDASKRVAMPGLVDARAPRPLRGDANEQSSEVTPAFRISPSLDPKSKELKRGLQMGATTLYIAPGESNVIAGLGVVIQPAGKTACDMILRDAAALHLTMGGEPTRGNQTPWFNRPETFYYRRPTTAMAVAWMLRKSFFDARQYAKSHDQRDPAMDVLASALHGEIPLRVAARRAIDIRTALRIAGEYGLRIILDDCVEGYKAAELIAEKRTPVVLGPFYCYPRTGVHFSEGEDVNWNNAGILARAGVKVALASGGESSATGLLDAAVFAVRHGMPRDQALRAVTLTAAEILGVADRVGSLEKGKDADILIVDGDPLLSAPRVERVVLKGATVYEAKQQGESR